MVKKWKSKELKALENNYDKKSAKELSEIIGRTAGGVSTKIRSLYFENPSNWDKKQVNRIVGEALRIYRGRNINDYGKYQKWSKEEINKLRSLYLDHDLLKLEERLKRSKWGIKLKLEQLAEEDNEGWDKKRVRKFNTFLHRNLREDKRTGEFEIRQEQKEKQRRIVEEKVKNLDIKRKKCSSKGYNSLKKNKPVKKYQTTRPQKKVIKCLDRRDKSQWHERDEVILANTYFTHHYFGLAKIFKLKRIPFDIKLRELYIKNPESWEEERIEELEFEREKHPYSVLRKQIKNYKTMGRREEIDKEIKEGLTMPEIAKQLNVERQAIDQYISSRGLKTWYHSIEKND